MKVAGVPATAQMPWMEERERERVVQFDGSQELVFLSLLHSTTSLFEIRAINETSINSLAKNANEDDENWK